SVLPTMADASNVSLDMSNPTALRMGLPLYIQNLCSLILLNFTNKKTARLFSSSNFKFVVCSGRTVSAKGSYSFAVSDFIWVAGFGKDSCCDPNV
ncbi:TPA: hypothetical protein ACUV4I_002111, partial [Neisseria gonorrhoeae]